MINRSTNLSCDFNKDESIKVVKSQDLSDIENTNPHRRVVNFGLDTL